MSKQELIRELAQTTGISQKDCRIAVDAILEEVILILEEGARYSQTGFGTFRTEISEERISFNPALEKRMIIPVKKKVKFRASPRLKEAINE